MPAGELPAVDRRSAHRVLNGMCLLLVVFLVLFPKGGIKAAGTPLTWGYVLLGMTAPPAIALRLLALPLRFRPSAMMAFCTLIPFQLVCLYSMKTYGVDNLGILLSDLTGFVVLPGLFLLVFPAFLPFIDPVRFSRYFRFCLLGAALWGIFLFFWRPLFGYYIEIPLLTENLADAGLLEATKHIYRGAFFKLISTYNNGNLYGVATLILFPLYKQMETSRWKRNAVRVALVLTLSRTVWLGVVIEQLLSTAASLPAMVRALPRIHSGEARRRGTALLITLAVVFVGFLFSVQSLQFLFDTSLGGRTEQLKFLLHPSFLPTYPVTGFSEVVYGSALVFFGVAGLLSILLILMSPLLLLAVYPKLVAGPVQRSAAKGLILYSILAASDGAINLIPVLAFYWFAYMVFLYGLPGGESRVKGLERADRPLSSRGAATVGPRLEPGLDFEWTGEAGREAI